MTSDILLREVAKADLPILYEQQLDPEATAMAAFPSRDREAFMAHSAKIMADPTVIFRTIVYGGQAAGSIFCWETEGNSEVGYWLGREFWGKGIATQALQDFVGMVTTRPLFAHAAKHNIGSKRVLEKCGFTVVGEDRYTNRVGELVDEFLLKLEA
jgi:RimJ/RimL family protein N-acetyltransferase